eukprot:scaffold84644_cov72-Phaeocystis_antarctica.AAC.1
MSQGRNTLGRHGSSGGILSMGRCRRVCGVWWICEARELRISISFESPDPREFGTRELAISPVRFSTTLPLAFPSGSW